MDKKEFTNLPKGNTLLINRELIKLITPRQFAVFLVWFILSTLIIAIPFFSVRVNVKPGQKAAYTLLSPFEIEMETSVDKLATEKVKAEKLKQIEDVYDVDRTVTEKARNALQAFFYKTKQIKRLAPTAPERERLQRELEYQILPRTKRVLWETDLAVLNLIESFLLQSFDIMMEEGVLDKNTIEVKEKINNEVSKTSLDIRYKQTIADILYHALENNKTLNVVASNQKKSQAILSVAPVKTYFVKNQPIFYKDDTITPEHIEILKKIGLYGSLIDPLNILAVALLNFLTMGMLWAYFLKYRYALLNKTRLLIFLALSSIVLLFLARLLININIWYFPIVMFTLFYIIVFSDQTLTFMLLLYNCIFTALIFHFDFQVFFVLVFSVLCGIYFGRRITQRTDITGAAFYTAVATILILLLVSWLSGNFVFNDFFFNSLKILGMALISAIVVIGLLPYVEEYFNVITSIKLLELSSPNMPLLKRLLIEAPGTYHHSIMVANLAEAAIERIGGNALLARVAAYYHDIGKIKRPYFFVENQIGLENPHDKLSVNLSVLLILAHVKDGIDLGLRYKLPPSIIDIIAQHHGTSLLSYFYRDYLQKKNQGKSELSLTEENFHYPGPCPQTREAAVIMIADACEAGIRSLEKTTPGKVRSMIQQIIKEKFSTGQLDFSTLTFRDLKVIEESFMERLAGLFHSRISYTEGQK